MKYLTLAVVLGAATGISIGFRYGISGTAEASRQEPSSDRLDRAAELVRLEGTLEGASLPMMPVGTGLADEKSDREFARMAADTGDRLLNRARQSPYNPHLLRQAAAHYRAALTHEPTVRDAGDLFVMVRVKLIRLDLEIARLDRPGVAKPTTRASVPPAIVKTPSAVVKPKLPAPFVSLPVIAKPEATMFGPDGVEIRRVGPSE